MFTLVKVFKEMQASNVFTAISGLPELGMIWMSDMMVPNDLTQELFLDSQQTESTFFNHGHTFDELKNHTQSASEDYDVNPKETSSYLDIEEFLVDKEEHVRTNAATQTQGNKSRKIKPVKHPELILKTPIAYQPYTNLNFIPIAEDGRGVCQRCGAIGVKHSFYTKERRFCSRECARSSENITYLTNPLSNEKDIKEDNAGDSVVNEIKSTLKESLDKAINNTKLKPVTKGKSKMFLPEKVVPEDLPFRRKKNTELAKSFDWISQFKEPEFSAAPVSCFKHAPMSEIWDNISIGMKVEVENTDCDEVCEAFPDSFWVATVIRLYGYKALLRYEGFGDSAEKDFFVSLCANDVHPVGWCATIGKPLIPPNSIANKYHDWKEFLTLRLTGARTLPTDYYNKANSSINSRFRCGLNLEVVDKNHISQVKVATIQKIIGKRLHIRYYDSSPEDNGFWCHEDSPLIHHVGWAKMVGHLLDAYPEYLERVNKCQFNEDDATSDLFCVPKLNSVSPNYSFREGMKIEAIDPLNLSSICAATVMQVLKENYIMIRIDSYDEDAAGSDWFCYHNCSTCIFPIGFCSQNSLLLTPPKGYDPTTFSWDLYLQTTNAVPAPSQLFNRDIINHGFKEGMKLEAADLMDPRLVCVATITKVVGRLLKVHFDGWEDEYDQWLDCKSPDIYPIGWCDLVDHKLEGPRIINKNLNGLSKSNKIPKRKIKRRLKKITKSSKNYILHTFCLDHKQDLQKIFKKEKKDLQEQDNNIVLIKNSNSENFPEKNSTECNPTQIYVCVNYEQNTKESENSELLQNNDYLNNKCSSAEILTPSSTNKNFQNEKCIPRITDGFLKNSHSVKLMPEDWNVLDVSNFLSINDCKAYSSEFRKRNIDGRILLSLTKDQIMDLTNFKVGPSLKIYDLIQQIKIKVNPAQRRLPIG